MILPKVTNTGPSASLPLRYCTTELLWIDVMMPMAITITMGPTSNTTRYSVNRFEKLRGLDTYQT
jgi:hypothetical protein